MAKDIVKTGTLHVYRRAITDMIHNFNSGGWYFIGRSYMDFGFVHDWEIGPYKTIKEGLKEFNEVCDIGRRNNHLPKG